MPEYLPIQAHYHAHRLTVAGTAEDAFTRSLTSARVEMNPHQVDAALFALAAPYAKGVLLADEVGLGKTIEAGLVMSQKWAEQKQRILLIVPASLRKQWQQELFDKFSLKSRILEAKTHSEMRKAGQARPFETAGSVLISSYEFAARKADEIRAVKWDLVVFDEAHRLRNVHRKNTAKGAKALKHAVDGCFKILLTATPLQNSLMELFGIVSMIDDTHFGGENAFRTQYAGAGTTPASQEILRERLKSICHRTLRRQVQEAGHINFRQRHAVTFKFEPYDQETNLYDMLSSYLQDTGTIAYGGKTNALVVLQARKSLGSSTFAVARYLDTLLERLRKQQRASPAMTDDFEDVFQEEREAFDDGSDESDDAVVDPVALAAEIVLVESMRDLAQSIGVNAKGEKLIKNLPEVLDQIKAKGGQRKAVIFTESVRTQKYLRQLLTDHGYEGRIVMMNGSNNDDDSREIYARWKERHAGTDRISGSKTADMKAAIVEAFKSDDRTILIATESGAEGINLQFCSLLINYDLPWNPQRVEQRIGRCHRYGQLVDVTVVNMLNMKNRAEARIHELLEHKLHLFEGVFGSSDEVLGILTDGIDFEKEVLRIMQQCRSDEQADREFDELTARIHDSITADLEAARAKVLENMDADVVAKLHRRNEALAQILPEFKQRLLMVAKAELPEARFPTPDSESFGWDGKQWTTKWPLADENDWQFFRVNEGLGDDLIKRAKARVVQDGAEYVRFDPSAYPYPGQLGGVSDLIGQSGWLRAFKATMPTAGAEREEVIVIAETDAGELVKPQVCDKMMMAPAQSLGPVDGNIPHDRLTRLQDFEFGHFSERVKRENYAWLIEEEERLGRYARDMEIEIEAQIADLDAELKDLQRQKLSPLLDMEEKVAIMRDIRKKEGARDDLKMSQFEAKKAVNKDIGDKLDAFSTLLDQKPRLEEMFTLRWSVA
ncbi:MAG: SNF2-related protein [Sphingomonas sp.]|uniref:SNF2-related protein n=1 Tax=Sphingomonas sp. TaxID=28214 RepID=UPI003567BC52